jgi:Kef-type K+ transport system membrane component KefB
VAGGTSKAEDVLIRSVRPGREAVSVSFAVLAVISVVALLGPLLALPERWHLPVVLGELLAGITLGPTVLDALHASDPGFAFLAEVGFALVMFVAGTHVPLRDPSLRDSAWLGLLRAAGVGVVAAVLGVVVSRVFGTGHAAMYAVLMASSSAALILPVIQSLRLTGPAVLQLLPQIAIADAACIVALPLAVDPAHAGRAAVGAVAVLGAAGVAFIILWWLERRGVRKRAHNVSEQRKFALELRVNLAILFGMAALAVGLHVSVMLAGFSFGLVVAAIGEPRRLARQLFAVTEGFFGPLFFVWLGTSLDLRDLASHRSYILLGLVLGLGAVVAHLSMRAGGQPLAAGGLASAQLGVPVAAATVGTQLHLLAPGEPAALILGALVTIGVAVLCGALMARNTAAVTPAAAGTNGIPR